jgi:hypothetical protein
MVLARARKAPPMSPLNLLNQALLLFGFLTMS